MIKETFKISKKTVKGKTYYTAAVVKSYREKGKVKQKTIKSFGGVTWEEAQRLKLTYTAKSIEGLIHIDDIECEEGVSYGGIYVVRHLWRYFLSHSHSDRISFKEKGHTNQCRYFFKKDKQN